MKNALMQNGLIYEFQMEHVPQHDWTAQPEPQQEFVQPALPTIEKTTEPEPEVLLPPAEITPPEPVKETVSPLVSTMPATTLTIPQREAEPDVSDIADSPVQDEPLTPIPKNHFHSDCRGKIRVPQRQCFCRKAKVFAGNNACKTSAEGTYQDPCAGRDFRKLHYR
ncbi:MAG: hypothetical protein ACLR5S_05415 [Ruminococcus sp.]